MNLFEYLQDLKKDLTEIDKRLDNLDKDLTELAESVDKLERSFNGLPPTDSGGTF